MRTQPQSIEETAPDWLLALVRHTLKRTNPQDETAKGGEEKSKDLRRQVVARNLFFFDELHRVLEMFNGAGISVIVLKGAALAEGLYPHLGLRPFGDIDLLIHREALPRVIEILCGFGYRPYAPQQRPGAEDFQGAVNYVKDGELPIMIEPHWTFGAPYPYPGRLDMVGVWERARKAKIAGVDTLVLCSEDFLLHLCLHLFQHCWGVWLTSSCDIAELIHHYEGSLDWKAFLSRAFEFKICLPVRYSLQRTYELFHPSIPCFVLDELSSYKPSRFESRVFALLTSPGDKVRRGLAQFLTMPGATLRLRYLWAMLFPSRDFILSRYAIANPKRLPFYYVLRLKDTFLPALKGLFRFAF